MRLRFLIITLTFIMSLKKALSYIIQQKHNHNAALIEVLKNSVKEAKTQERIIFLLKCKKSNVIPKFIQNPIKHTRKISKNDGFQRKVDSRVLTTSVHTTYLLHSTYIHFAWLTANVSCTICWLLAMWLCIYLLIMNSQRGSGVRMFADFTVI